MEQKILKTNRAKLLSDFINEIKVSIKKHNIKGELPSKTYIYTRIADYTHYAEVSIRKFLTGSIPKDIASFVQGIIEYAKLVQVDDSKIDTFAKNYLSATNTVIFNDTTIKTKNNLIPQDLTKIIRSQKLTTFLDDFIDGSINISYIYGYKLGGKSKSVMAYMYDLTFKNKFENMIWINLKKENQLSTIFDTILLFNLENKAKINPEEKSETCFQFIKTSKSILILDFDDDNINPETIELMKQYAPFSKIVMITAIPYHQYENQLASYSSSFCINDFISKEELTTMLNTTEDFKKIMDMQPSLANTLYSITGGIPFASIYLMKKIVSANRVGISLENAISKYTKTNTDYKIMSEKIINDIWNTLSPTAKKLLIICANFKYTISIELISYILNLDILSDEWQNAITECYTNDLLIPILQNNPRLDMHNLIKTLVLVNASEEDFDKTIFFRQLANFYIDKSAYVGECYNDVSKLKLFDELDEWNITKQVLTILEENKLYKEYITIVRNLKYYIYVRGMWEKGKNSPHLKRAQMANMIQDKNEELEALCDYINIMSKSQNADEALKYLDIASKIVDKEKEHIEKRIVCLFYHVKALYMCNCLKQYKESYEIWTFIKENYFPYINEYRKLVTDLWITRCYLKIEDSCDLKYAMLVNRLEEAKQANFTRGQADYCLLLISLLLENYTVTKDTKFLEMTNTELIACEEFLKKQDTFDIRNKALYYRLKAIYSMYTDDFTKSQEFAEKAIKDYEMMNCKKDIESLLEILDR